MKVAKVIIGAGWGDEGKGLLTDYWAAGSAGISDTVVVRFNGGAQAGHTVQLPDGRRHVFSHLGAGTFAGARTFLSRFFICNPFLLNKELMCLGTDLRPAYQIAEMAPLTTPYDMLINQVVEQVRGANRHGSCGVGINETITRNHTEYCTYAKDFLEPRALRIKLERIKNEYLPARFKALGVTEIPDWAKEALESKIAETYMTFGEHLVAPYLTKDDVAFASASNIIFEGAQGLLLDEYHRWFPHVTRSRTGLHNVLTLALEAGIEKLEVVYVTRSYATRHGAGPFPREDFNLKFPDETNVPNPHQGALRFGYLDLDLLVETIHSDMDLTTGRIRMTPAIAVTCLDQQSDGVPYWRGNKLQFDPITSRFPIIVKEALGFNLAYASWGPTRNTLFWV